MSAAAEFTSTSPEQTVALGRVLGSLLRGGDFIALSGPLGAGKTQFVKGVALGLGVDPSEPVVSPTFVLVREYAGNLRLYHIDAYRLAGAGELFSLGLEEMTGEADAVVAVEWADRVPQAVPASACRVELSHRDKCTRDVQVDWPDEGRLGRLEYAAAARGATNLDR